MIINQTEKISQQLDKLMYYPGCERTLHKRKILWFANFLGLAYVLPFTLFLQILQPNAVTSLYYGYSMIFALSISLIILPTLKKYFDLYCMFEAVLKVLVTFFFILKQGGIPDSFNLIFLALAFVFLTIPLKIVWFIKALFVLFSVLTIVVAILGQSMKAPTEELLDFNLKVLVSVKGFLVMSALALYFVIAFMKKLQKLEELEAIKQKELYKAKAVPDHMAKSDVSISHEGKWSGNHLTESHEPAFMTEDAFVMKVRNIMEKNLDNDMYNINDLCSELAVSHAQLYRKFKSKSNIGIFKYFKILRLNKARELLTTSNLNVTQVAFEAGFKNLSHFSREFALKFGKTPKKMQKDNLANLVQTKPY